jgi:mycofactocin system glycosyltransferase
VLDPSVRRSRPEVLVGGAPLRVLRLTLAGAALVDRWAAGATVGQGAGEQTLARRLLDAGIAHPVPDPASGAHPGGVTVVIPVRDRTAGLAVTLAALAADTPAGGGIIVVDDGSEPPVEIDPGLAAGASVTKLINAGAGPERAPERSTAGAGPERAPERSTAGAGPERAPERSTGANAGAGCRQTRPLGPAAARNTGWRAASTEFVAFVDADCSPSPGWLSALLPHFADPAVGAVAPRVVTEPSPGTPAGIKAYEALRSPLDLGDRPAPVHPGSRVPYVPTAALVVRRQALDDVNGFDESMLFGEDVDLVWRLDKARWKVRYEPGATVRHPSRPGMPAWLQQRYRYGRSAAPLASRHGRAVAPVAVSPWSALAWAAAATGHPGSAAATALLTAAVLARRAGSDRATAKVLAGLAITGHARAGSVIAEGVRRAWLPPAVAVAALAWRTHNRWPALALAAAWVVPPLMEWRRQPAPGIGGMRWSALRLSDDLAYQAGLWSGVIESRSAGALLPRW